MAVGQENMFFRILELNLRIFVLSLFFVSLQHIMMISNWNGEIKDVLFESGLTDHIVPNAPPLPEWGSTRSYDYLSF